MIMKNKLKYRFLPKTLRNIWSYDDFLSYRMQEMSLSQIENLLTVGELWQAEKQLNNNEYRHIFNSKKTFARYFGKYMLRDILYLDEAGPNEFEAFINKHDRVILKPNDMYAGIGISVINAGNKLPDFDSLRDQHYIAEEYIKQSEKYAYVYPGSLNTIRVTTLIGDEGNPKVLFAINQFGSRGSIVDNDDDTAIWADINLKTGGITCCDIDARTGYVNEVHPDTGVNLLEFVNDDIDKICALALEAAKVVPRCRLIGWDIAVRADGRLEIVEGNVTPELELYQKMTGNGLKNALI